MAHSSGLVIESQVDYLRASVHGERAASHLLHLAQGLQEEEKSRGNRERRWRLMGYEGTRAGRVAYGQRDQASTTIDLSGDSANEYLAAVLPLADTVTRVDLAVTWRADPPVPFLGQDTYQAAFAWYKAARGRALPTCILNGSGGSTVYLGKRTSENFLRIYNKEAECRATGDWPNVARYRDCWRFELEVKGGLAHKLAHEVAEEKERYFYVSTYLHRYLEAHGIPPPFDHWTADSLLPGFHRRSDDEVTLKHLARNVAPSVRRLQAHGRGEHALQALGLAGSKETLTLGGYPIRSVVTYHPSDATRRASQDGDGVVSVKEASPHVRDEP